MPLDLSTQNLAENRLTSRASEQVAGHVHQATTVVVAVAARQHVEDSSESRIGLASLLTLSTEEAAEASRIEATGSQATPEITHHDWCEHRQ